MKTFANQNGQLVSNSRLQCSQILVHITHVNTA